MKFKPKLFSPLQQDNYVFTVPPMNDGDDERGHQMRVQTSVMDRVVAGNLNATFREALRSFYTLDDLKAFAPKDKQEAKWLIHQVEHTKPFSIHLHNSWVKKHQRRVRPATDLSGRTSEGVARSDAGLPLTQRRRKVCSTNLAQFKIHLESQLETFKNQFVFL